MVATRYPARKAFEFMRVAQREEKPRSKGLTEIRDIGLGIRHLEDLCEVAAEYIDILKMGAAHQRLLSRDLVKRKLELCKDYGIMVSTGGTLERVLLQGQEFVNSFLEEAKSLGFEVIEISTGLLILPLEQKLELIKLVKEAGLKPKPEVAMAYGIAFGERSIGAEFKEVPISADKLIHEAKKSVEAGAWKVMIESEGLTENVPSIREEVIHKITSSFNLNQLMFEAADIKVLEWYVKNYGSEVNLFVDHSQILWLEWVRRGLWGLKDTWGRVATFMPKM